MGYQFFQNKECEYFPCHKVKEAKIGEFSCLFCFCPLYLDSECGGKYHILDNKWKDCSECTIPHFNYDYIIKKLKYNHIMHNSSINN